MLLHSLITPTRTWLAIQEVLAPRPQPVKWWTNVWAKLLILLLPTEAHSLSRLIMETRKSLLKAKPGGWTPSTVPIQCLLLLFQTILPAKPKHCRPEFWLM